jgi:hypothetical protein
MPRGQQVEALWNGLTDASGQPLASGKVFSYIAGTTTPKALYTAGDLSATAANPVILDAVGKSQIWGAGAYKFVIKTAADVTLQTLDNLYYFIDNQVVIDGGTSTGSANAYASTPSPSVGSLVNGMVVVFVANFTNSGACTFNLSGLGAVPIRLGDGSVAIPANSIRASSTYMIKYDLPGGRWLLLSTSSQLSDTYVPTVTCNNGTTVSALVVSRAKFMPNQNRINLNVYIQCTLSGGTGNELTITLPTVSAQAINESAYVFDGGTDRNGLLLISAGTSNARLYKPDLSTGFTLGAAKEFGFNIEYETQ